MKFTNILIGLMTFFLLTACHQKKQLSEAEITQIAKEAYIYGYPIVENYRNMYISVIDAQNPNYVKPFNELVITPFLQTVINEVVETETLSENVGIEKTETDVTLNLKPIETDVAYGNVWLDLRREPYVITIPATGKRYYSVQFVDLFTEDIDYISNRKNGNTGGRYLIVSTSWKGSKPTGIDRVIESPTDFLLALFRIQVKGVSDMESIKKLQGQIKLESLSQYTRTTSPPVLPIIDFPVYNSAKAKTPEFFTYMNFILQFCTIQKEEKDMMKRFAEIGIGPGMSFNFGSMSNSEKKALIDGMAAGQAKLDMMQKAGNIKVPDFSMPKDKLKENYSYRAFIAAVNLYGNSSEEIWENVYELSSNRKILNGLNHYELKFDKDKLPPVNAFWSLKAYPLPKPVLSPNVYTPYIFNSSSRSFKLDDNGSLTLYVQHDVPEEAKLSNWLRVPNGNFFVLLQLYQPKEEVIKGLWPVPKMKYLSAGNSSILTSASLAVSRKLSGTKIARIAH